jgi:hypothetical protein
VSGLVPQVGARGDGVKRYPYHIVLEGPRIHCTHCRSVFLTGLPMPVRGYLNVLNAFIKLHRECQPKEIETK